MATLKNRRREAAAKASAKRTPRAAEAAKQAADAAQAAAAAASEALAAEQAAAQQQAAWDVSRETPDPVAVATLETLQQTLAQQTAAQQRTPPPDPVAMATIDTLQQALGRQDRVLSELSALVARQGQQLETLLKRPVDVAVEAGGVEVNIPDAPKPSSFLCEFDDGRTATLTPLYDDQVLN